MKSLLRLGLMALVSERVSAAITMDLSNPDSVKQAASTAAAGMVQYYTGYRPGDVAGNLPSPYYWWEAGAMFGALIDYWYFTGDDQYNDITIQAMMHQAGPNADFMPLNQTKTEGNDDQAFWGMAALSAAENNFPNPPDGQPQWLAMAQAVFNEQANRWDLSSCGGGLKWQIFTFNAGYNYKNTISNGCFFNMASRLAAYTGNETYSDWAVKMWDWADAIGLFDADYNFFDGSDDTINCTQLDHLQWTYNAGTFLVGAANMYNTTGGDQLWKTRIDGIIAGIQRVFLQNNVIYEAACEPSNTCDVDQRSFKAYLSRWMAATAIRAPYTYETLKPILESSAQAAVATCTGGSDGNQCGLKWTTGSFDGNLGVGEQMSALEVIQSNLIPYVQGPVTATTGGTSQGDPNAGTKTGNTPIRFAPITITDRVGAGVMTLGFVLLIVGTACWMIL